MLALTLLDTVPPVTHRDDANPPPFTAPPGSGTSRLALASESLRSVVKTLVICTGQVPKQPG